MKHQWALREFTLSSAQGGGEAKSYAMLAKYLGILRASWAVC